MITVKFMRKNPEARLPVRAYKDDACYDFFAVEDVTISPRSFKDVKTGWATEIPEGYCITYRARSSQGSKGIQVHNGTIDCGYRGEHSVYIYNHSDKDWVVEKGNKVCQMFLDKVQDWGVEEVKELNESERGEKGFGSSGK